MNEIPSKLAANVLSFGVLMLERPCKKDIIADFFATF